MIEPPTQPIGFRVSSPGETIIGRHGISKFFHGAGFMGAALAKYHLPALVVFLIGAGKYRIGRGKGILG
jgi:hypothetical protein